MSAPELSPGELATVERFGFDKPEEVTHACPPRGSGLTPCCGVTPFELPGTDRMTLDASLVTCGSAS